MTAVREPLPRVDSAIGTIEKAKPQRRSSTDSDDFTTCHPLRDVVSAQVHEYTLAHWEFSGDEKTMQNFLNHEIAGTACVLFPSALDERIFLIARLSSILFLIGEAVAELDADDGEEYVSALEAAVKGFWSPDETIPAVWMLCSLFDEMRALDYLTVDDIVDTTFAHLRANLVRRGRSTCRQPPSSPTKGFRIGAALMSALETFATGTSLEY